MGAKASYLIFCDPAPANLGLRTDVELLHINSKLLNANPFRVADKPNVFLNKQGEDIGTLTAEDIRVDADITLEGNAKRGFRLYVCIEGTPCTGVGHDPLQAVVHNGRALLNDSVRLSDQDRDCSDYLDAMLKQEEANLDASAPLGRDTNDGKNLSEKARTAAIIKNLLNR